jgi:hypothetical protein
MARLLARLVLTALLSGWSGAAHAFTVGSAITDGCHEDLSLQALAGARAELVARGAGDAAPVWPPTHEERAIATDLPAPLDADSTDDLAALALVIGVRAPDLGALRPGDLEELTQVHGAPANQDRHFLRRPDQDGEEGSMAAALDARAQLREQALAALEGLDGAGRPDRQATEELEVGLSFRGSVRVRLPRFYVRMGQALHTLQDSFSHTLRTPGGMQITSVLNWVDLAEGKLDEGRDGMPHLAPLDDCRSEDELVRIRVGLALQASRELLVLWLDPAIDRVSREAGLAALMERYLEHRSGCSAVNDFCSAAERVYEGQSQGAFGCAVVPGAAPASAKASAGRSRGLILLVLGALALGAGLTVRERWRCARQS